MDDVNKMIKDIRPSLRDVAPQTYWFSIGFGLFNTIVGIAMYNIVILYTLKLVGIIPIRVWGLIFVVVGSSMLLGVMINNWKLVRTMHAVGILVKTAWWLELLAVSITGRSPFLLLIWSLLLFLQIIIWIYFTPRIERE